MGYLSYICCIYILYIIYITVEHLTDEQSISLKRIYLPKKGQLMSEAWLKPSNISFTKALRRLLCPQLRLQNEVFWFQIGLPLPCLRPGAQSLQRTQVVIKRMTEILLPSIHPSFYPSIRPSLTASFIPRGAGAHPSCQWGGYSLNKPPDHCFVGIQDYSSYCKIDVVFVPLSVYESNPLTPLLQNMS